MAFRHLIVISLAGLLLCAAQSLLGQPCHEYEGTEQPSRYELKDISTDGSPVQVVGHVTFRDNPALVMRYWFDVEALVKNVSKKEVLSWSVRFQTKDGHASGLNFSYSHDYFLTGDVLSLNDAENVHPCPSRFATAVVNGVPISEDDDSGEITTAIARVEFVQFRDGSTWGDRDIESEIFRVRRETLQKLQSLQTTYSQQGEKAFMDALAESAPLPCIERIKRDCGDSRCALNVVQSMLATAARRGFLEKP